jgi:hypothetical protein
MRNISEWMEHVIEPPLVAGFMAAGCYAGGGSFLFFLFLRGCNVSAVFRPRCEAQRWPDRATAEARRGGCWGVR